MFAADRFMQYLGVSDLRRRVLVLATLAVTLPPIGLYGHPEDLLALGAMLYGLVVALERRAGAAGWWFAVALGFQFLAFLAVPLVLVLLPRRTWLATVARMVSIPLLVLIVPLVADPSVTIHQLLHQQVYFDSGYITPTWHLSPGAGAAVRLVVAVVSIPAALVLYRFLPEDRRRTGNLVLWTLGLLLALRVFEPELVPYFLAPALALFSLSAVRSSWWRLGATCALAVWVTYWLHAPMNAHWAPWLLLIAQIGALAFLGFPKLQGLGRRAPVPPTERRTTNVPAKSKPVSVQTKATAKARAKAR
jgi:hypothetical protein